MAKRYGVVGITKKENAQLGLILKYLWEDKDALPDEYLVDSDALAKLTARYANAV